MSSGTEKLSPTKKEFIPKSHFPISTEGAMLRGSFQSLVGTLIEAQQETKMPLWICGGDSEKLFGLLNFRKNSFKNAIKSKIADNINDWVD